MSISSRGNRLVKDKLVVNRWAEPIEAFVPIPELVEPICSCNIDDFENCLEQTDTSDYGAVLAHETTIDAAESILANGFDPSNEEMCTLRDRAVFGWIFEEDVGKYKSLENTNCDSVVLFGCPKERVYLSSYKSSAYLLGMGVIDTKTYERDYVMRWDNFLDILREYPGLVNHMKYDIGSLIT